MTQNYKPKSNQNVMMEQNQVEKGKVMVKIVMATKLGVASLVHSPYLYPGKIYQPLFPRTNRYQCQTVQLEASSGCGGTLLCFHCKHKTTGTHQVKSLLTTDHLLGNPVCGPCVFSVLYMTRRSINMYKTPSP